MHNNSSLGKRIPMSEKKQKILIVDDEELVLKSLNREFHDADFETVLADSAEKGLEILQGHDIDMVITDINMPGMNGLEFLKIVKDRHPGVTRIILSSFVEESLVIPAITQRVADAYYTKPWITKSFRNAVEQTLVLRATLKDQALLSLISRIDRLPTLPLIYQEFEKAVQKDLPIKRIAGIVQEDVSISTRLLQVVNSAFYGQGKISSIDRAIMALGLKFVKDIVFAVSLIEKMKWNPTQVRHLERIFLHSSLVSFAVKVVYETAFGKKIDDRYASAGVTHDIGRVILLQYFTDRYEEVLAHQRANPEKNFEACEIEMGYAGMTHCEIGAYFLNWWNLPDANIRLALFHHAFKEVHDPAKPEIQDIFFHANLWVNRLMGDQQVAPEELTRFFGGFLKEGIIAAIEGQLLEKIGQQKP
jgi:HD-like signal output (HDOD) protein